MNKEALLQETYDSAFNDELEKYAYNLKEVGNDITPLAVGSGGGVAASALYKTIAERNLNKAHSRLGRSAVTLFSRDMKGQLANKPKSFRFKSHDKILKKIIDKSKKHSRIGSKIGWGVAGLGALGTGYKLTKRILDKN